MSRDAQHPRGADRPAGAFDIPEGEPDRPADRRGEAPLTYGVSPGLFDPAAELSTVRHVENQDAHLDVFGPDQADSRPARAAPRRDTGPIFGSQILGAGPEVARGPRREPTGRHEALRAAPFAPVATVPPFAPSALERVVDAVHRWRSPLGLGLAALITVGVVVGYQRWPAGEEIAAGGSGGDGRSAFASVTEFDEPVENTATEGATEPQRDVNSTVDEATDTTPSITEPGAATPVTDAPASPTTATTPTSSGSAPTTTPTAPTTSADNPTSAPPESSPTSQPSSTAASASSTSASAAPATSSTTAAPATSSTAAPTSTPVRTEAEAAATAGGATVADERTGFSGTGYITELDTVGAGVSFTVDSAGGTVPFAIGYSAGPIQGAPRLRTVSIIVDGDRKTSARMEATPTFDDWTIVAGTLELPAGRSVITIEVQAGDSGQVNIDYIEVG